MKDCDTCQDIAKMLAARCNQVIEQERELVRLRERVAELERQLEQREDRDYGG